MRIEHHPKLNVWLREDGCVYLPQSGTHPAHWTFGCNNKQGYLVVRIKGNAYYVHRLVAEAFIGPIPDGYQADHIDRDRLNNAKDNIRIVTPSQNSRNTSAHDRVDARGGTHRYENEKQYLLEKIVDYRKTHKCVRLSDGKNRWFPNEQATELLKLPVKERKYDKI